MGISLVLIGLGALLAASALGWTRVWDRNSISELHDRLKTGRLRVGLYATIVAPISLALVIAGVYLALLLR